MSVNQEQYELLESYVCGDLDAAGRAQVQALLAQNPQLQQMLKELTAHRDMLRQLPRASAPEDLLESFQAQLEREALLGDSAMSIEPRNRVERWPRFVLAAAIFFMVCGLIALIYEVLPEHRDTIPLVDSQGVSTDLDRSSTSPTTRPVLGDLAPPAPSGNLGGSLSDTGLGNGGNSPRALPTTQLLDGAIAKAVGGGSHGFAAVTDENLRQLKQTLELNTTTRPSDIPIVIVIRSQNPGQADAQVAQFLQSNGIVFDSTPPRQSSRDRGEVAPQGPTTQRESFADSQRALADKLTFKARLVAPLPVTLPSTPVAASEAPKPQQQHSQALAFRGGSQSNQAQDQAPAQVTYRALLTDQQVQLLNSELLDRPNQWTEVHGQIATDALESNAMRNAVTIAENRVPAVSNGHFSELKAYREKLTPTTEATRESGAIVALGTATQPIATTQDYSLIIPSSQPATQPSESPIQVTATTQPITVATTAPSAMRTCLIIVNTQPVAFPAASEPATTEATATTEAATTEPATQP